MVSKSPSSLIYLLPVTNCNSSPTTSSSGSHLPILITPCPRMMSREVHDDCKIGRTINSLIIILFCHPHDRSLAVATKPSSNKLMLLNQPRFAKQWKESQWFMQTWKKCRWDRNWPNMKPPQALPAYHFWHSTYFALPLYMLRSFWNLFYFTR